MNEDRTVGRRQFTLAAAMLALSSATITISACGGGSSSPSSPSSGGAQGATDKVGVIGSNHGHSAVITAAQLTAAGDLSLDIKGTSDHPHTVTLTGAQVASIGANQRVSKESSTDDGHSHSVTFN